VFQGLCHQQQSWGARRIFSRGRGKFRDSKKLTTFLVVTLKTQVFTVTINAQNTSQHFQWGEQVPPKHFIFSKGSYVFVEKVGACFTAVWHNGQSKPACSITCYNKKVLNEFRPLANVDKILVVNIHGNCPSCQFLNVVLICIGVPRILSGVHFFSKKLTTFFSRRPIFPVNYAYFFSAHCTPWLRQRLCNLEVSLQVQCVLIEVSTCMPREN